MYEKLIKTTVTIVALTFITCLLTNAQPVLKRSAETLNEAMPARVVHLFNYWPDASVLSGPNRMLGNENRWIALVKKESIDWIKKVLNPAWLPETKDYLQDNLIMVRNEYDEFDVTRVQWTKNRYIIKVAQTASIITIKFTPIESTNVGETTEQKREFAKALCRQIVNSSGIRYGIRHVVDKKGKLVKRPINVAVKNLAAKICGYFFRAELTREFPDGVIGVAPTPEQEGIPWTPRDGNDVNARNLEDNPNWDKSWSSWGYWWRHVCWWNDGKSIGFFMLRKEAGAIGINYWDNFGSRWFEDRKSTRLNSSH